MIHQKEDKVEFFNTIIFVLLFFLFICAFTHKPEPPIRKTSQHELSIKTTGNAATNQVSQIVELASLIPSIDKSKVNYSNKVNQLSSENRLIKHKLASLRKTELKITPLISPIQIICKHLALPEEPPILS